MERLKLLRKEKHLTQTKLGAKTGYTQQAIANYENGRNSPGIKTLCTFADFFNTSTDYLLERTDYPRRPCFDDNFTISQEESDILEQFRDLEKEHKEYVLSSIAILRESESRYHK